jgi:hypothetical protein
VDKGQLVEVCTILVFFYYVNFVVFIGFYNDNFKFYEFLLMQKTLLLCFHAFEGQGQQALIASTMIL